MLPPAASFNEPGTAAPEQPPVQAHAPPPFDAPTPCPASTWLKRVKTSADDGNAAEDDCTENEGETPSRFEGE
jgi:hypothetical protein